METSVKSGDKGEILAIKYLLKKDYKIITTNYKIQGGEIDIISEFGKTIVFIEVKYRKNDTYGIPEETLTKNKRKNILKAIKYFSLKNKISEDDIRFEFIGIREINSKIQINHIKDIEL